jgi:pyruvate formate lyase activating enzyme
MAIFFMKEALFYTKNSDKSVQCFLCNHHCQIAAGSLGFCGVRLNTGGILYALNYDKLVAANIDPIEKKPLYHFLPGTTSYSIACAGCNFRCDFCQNWEISQATEAKKLGVEGFGVLPEKIVQEALRNNCPSISYTYTEPTIYFELAYQTAKLAAEKELYNIFVTNGYMSKEALEYISPYLDAANIDLKSFHQDFYQKVCKAKLEPVLENIKLMRKLDIWVEVTTLVVTGRNDSDEELDDIAVFLAGVDKDIPWHISAFHPDYKLTDLAATPPATLERAYKIGKSRGLKHVYIGNARTSYGENTYCAFCSEMLIERNGFLIISNNLKEGRCKYCNQPVKGIWL